MITGFNPADMYAVDHIRRVLQVFPASSRASASSAIHKEFVSSKVSGETASLTNPALDRILDFAAEAGLVVILHSDIDMPFAKTDAEPVYLTQMKALLKRHPKTTIIWAHTGLGRVVHPATVSAEAAERNPNHVEIVEGLIADPASEPRAISTSPGTKSRSTPSRRRRRSHAPRHCSTSIPIVSCSAPTPSPRPARRRTTPCSTCGRRCFRS